MIREKPITYKITSKWYFYLSPVEFSFKSRFMNNGFGAYEEQMITFNKPPEATRYSGEKTGRYLVICVLVVSLPLA